MSEDKSDNPVNVSNAVGGRLQRSIDAMTNVGAIIASIGIFGVMFIAVIDVISRQLGGKGFFGAVEITQLALVPIAFLGMAASQAIKTPLLTNRLPSSAANASRALSTLIALGILVWIIVQTFQTAWQSLLVSELSYGSIQVLVWPSKMSIPIGLAGFAIVLLAEFTKHLLKFLRGEPAEKESMESLA